MSSIEDLVYGEDGEQPMRSSIETYLAQAKGDQVRLKIEIRTKMRGTTKSQQERVFEVDPNVTNVDAVMQTIDKSLKDSPGEDFTGQVRINFTQAGTSNRYGSFSRNVRASYADAPESVGLRSIVSDEGDDGEGGDEGDNTMSDLRPSPLAAMNLGMHYGGGGGGGGGSGPVSQEDMQRWLDTCMNFTFRSMAQQQQMFERAMQMIESLHFGLARPVEPGIVEHKGGAPEASNPGILGALISTAAQLAKAESPGEAVAAAAQLASGQAQPNPAAARQAAMAKAGKTVKRLAAGNAHEKAVAAYQGPSDPEDFEPEDDDGEEEAGEESGAVEWESLDNDEVKDGFLRWVRADPSRKRAVMDMLPELSKEVL